MAENLNKMPFALFPDMKKFGFLRTAAAVPQVFVADVNKNVEELVRVAIKASTQSVDLLVLPELCITGYSCGDLFHQAQLIDDAKQGLLVFAQLTAHLPMVIMVGLPLRASDGKLYNVAAAVSRGQILGFVPKIYLPTYGVFYEGRWFSKGEKADKFVDIPLQGSVRLSRMQTFKVSLGQDLSFEAGLVICEDDWKTPPPSNFLAIRGATVICNLSASNGEVGKDDYREQLVRQRSADGMTAYVYCSAGPTESTADLVFDGHCMIAENGTMLAERQLKDRDVEMIIADVDISSLKRERSREQTWGDSIEENADILDRYSCTSSIDLEPYASGYVELRRFVDPRPFVPSDPRRRYERCTKIIDLQTTGLEQRLLKVEAATGKRISVIGISGGLDSTLALLDAVKTYDRLGWDRKNIIAVTMPGPGTSSRTLKNAIALIKALGVTYRRIPITRAVTSHLRRLGHEPCWKCLQCQNAQARERTQILFDLGFVLGTGDLSEAAQGWCTFNGDHMSSYNVNCDVPKSLVKYLVRWFVDDDIFGAAVSLILRDILDTPISPELVKADKAGEIGHKTEDEIGPYDLHDFFLYHLVRKGEAPDKIFYLACIAFENEFEPVEIIKWLASFYRRFFASQFKRDCVPNGPVVGTISLSPRGYWRMPSDIGVPALWREIMASIADGIICHKINMQPY